MVKKKRQTDTLNDDGSSTDSSEERPLQSPTATAGAGGCQHVKKSVDTAKVRKQLRATGLVSDCAQCLRPKSATAAAAATSTSPAAEATETAFEDAMLGFEYDNTLWLCLKCGTQLCGRSRNQHALQHYKTPHSDSHALTMNTRSFEIWCYDCDNEVSANSRKNLLECVEIVKKVAQKPLQSPPPLVQAASETGTVIKDVENKIISTWQSMCPLVPQRNDIDATANTNAEGIGNKIISLPPPPPPPPIPGMAKRVNDPASGSVTPAAAVPTTSSSFGQFNSYPMLHTGGSFTSQRLNEKIDAVGVEKLPRVRGLTNLGNTCFFNAVMQCLAQTPYLLEVLKESSEPGEEFILPGGTFKFKDGEDMELPMIKGTLSSWGSLTSALAQALDELQSGGGIFTPSKLFDKLCAKCPQFCGGDQHDSHELLRHLLESVRSEDLKRYQRVILQNLGYKDQDINTVSEEMRQKCKIYGNQAADRILRPEQVFRGFLVSTLTCQACFNVSSRHEYFLDMSLPVSVEKPQPPQRRKSPDSAPAHAFFIDPHPVGPTKAQLKKEKEKARKVMRAAKHQQKHQARKQQLESATATGGAGDAMPSADADRPNTSAGNNREGEEQAFSSYSSSSEQSDADVEDNLIDDKMTEKSELRSAAAAGGQSKGGALVALTAQLCDSNGNAQLASPSNPEKRDDSPENMDKDSLDEDENDSGIATSPANPASNNEPCLTAATNSIVAVGLSEKGVNLVRQLSLSDSHGQGQEQKQDSVSAIASPTATAAVTLTNGDVSGVNQLSTRLDQMVLKEQKTASSGAGAAASAAARRTRAQRTRTHSYSDWSTTIAPRYQCEDGECSVQSCLNNFTGVELMTGNNKVGCENCTKRLNGDDPKAKTVNTNATKQFLISSPPAVLILHLKRFQLGPRCMFRKLTRSVSFPMVLDIAPFCGSKVKNLPNINRKQKKLLYALYGVVEHSGGMYGGHYTAYVKVRAKLSPEDQRWKFIPQGSKAELDQDDEQRKKLEELLAKEQAHNLRMKAADDSDDFSNSNSSSSSSSSADSCTMSDQEESAETQGAVGGFDAAAEAGNVQVPPGKWYYVSDSRVQEVNEDAVLRSQAYLLFYERIY